MLCPHRPEEGTGSPVTSQPRECWDQNLGPLEKVSALNRCTISPVPLYLKSSISKSVSVPCCLLTIPGEIQICIIIMIDPFLGKNLWIQAGERTPGEKACIAPGGPRFSSRRIYRLRLLQTPVLTGT